MDFSMSEVVEVENREYLKEFGLKKGAKAKPDAWDIYNNMISKVKDKYGSIEEHKEKTKKAVDWSDWYRPWTLDPKKIDQLSVGFEGEWK